ncbi:restriction endonuclease subunit S [Pseudoalteromonas sp. SG45-5]|uniref:restriction endonuclease subunit S n=1 Tax=unclassified Pseudoalteromonas TaxID=194690 RepID=UPI0015FD6734|nr:MULTISPECIES: restriction endonuclease subunit S [unclassified Pseudoalteromonas]MBB1386455.1 restriction endonuclease subunit S [Pseudoalteromonas sp. SG45-5]MBB1394495.1 restriction endonuclease subunit S [Pseudoalteromonas sp. SG44-4]MBB1446907.1 restriction endonuclease subunit S [Pseudoalteromonas sp. SG41-6]
MSINKANPEIRFPEFSDDWVSKPFGKIVSVTKRKYNPDKDHENLPCIELEHIEKGSGRVLGNCESKNQKSIKNRFSRGQVLFGKLRPNLKKLAIAPVDGVCSSEILPMESEELENEFLLYLMRTDKFFRVSTISSGSKMPRADMDFINAYPFFFPKDKLEQRKIAEFFNELEKKVNLLREKEECLKLYKKGLLQKIFKQEVRFKNNDGNFFPDWKERHFNDFIKQRTEYPNDLDSSPLASLTIETGIEMKSARYTRDFLVNDETEAYKLVYPNDFVANPMNLRFGAIAKNNLKSSVKISKYYDVFYVDESINMDFFELYLRSYEMMKTYHQTATGTLEEKKRVHFSEFIHFKKELPNKDEQDEIANFFLSLQSKIDAVKQQLELTQTFKKGLLQQMLV